ncbi:MAG: hypothetical protein KGY65_05345, partial [Candidatus Thermoplasmatota archaeon]|nr:hypothetical protein [Candidatus Thermoplasmatota archaeon]
MTDILLGVSPDYLYLQQGKITRVDSFHQPYFLAFKNTESETKDAKKQIQDLQKNNKDSIPWSYINRFGEVQEYDSFWHPSKKRHVFPIYVNQSFRVPEVSDYLFFNHNLFTAEHDIPYYQRVLVDIAAKNDQWIYDTHGKDQSVSMLVYDIEMSEFIPGKIDSPIDIIGFAAGNLSFQSSKNLETETFDFDFKHVPHVVDEDDIIQLVSRNEDEELDHLIQFCRTIPKYDIISGHNITGFDNKQVYGRVKKLLQDYQSSLSNKQKQPLTDFLQKYTRIDKSFHFGVGSDVVQIYPSGFDTYLAARKFYPNLESHSLKAVAPFLGYGVDDRLILTPEEITIDDTTLKYNRQDVIEQMGVSLQLIQLALPLAFTTGMPFETLLSAGAVNMWDHMALIRGAYNKKLMPATCRVNNIAKALTRDFHHISKRSDILKQAKEIKDQLSKEFIRVVKYGPEMPEWMLYPYVIHNEQAKDADQRSGYHMPGGMTIKPDKDADSHFIPWYKVVVADVGAMYPTILKAMNVGADTVQLCKKDETPDMWTWFKKLPKQFFHDQDVAWKPVNKEDDTFADKGYWVGVNIQKETGVVNDAMTGIMGMIAKIKQELQDVQQTGNAEEIKRLKMMYQSVKGARNAGTHGILAAPNVSGRQFNLWGACAITTKGQVILDDTLQMLKNKDIRVVYGDSVDAETDIIIREKGLIKIIKISDLFKKINSKITKENQHEYKKTINNIECLSVNDKGNSEWKKVLFIKRHPFRNNILNIQTQRGGIGVTKNHSLYTYSDRLQPISCKNLVEENDSIAHISKIKQETVTDYKIINALEPLIPFDESLNTWLNIPLTLETKHLFSHHQPRNNYKGGKSKKKFIRMNIKNAIELYKKGIIVTKDLEKSFISAYNGTGKIPVIYKFDEDFARLVGAYTAEGSLYFRKRKGLTKEGAHIFVCGHQKKNLDKLRKIAEKKFGRKFRITSSGMDKNGENYRIQGNSATAFLFYYVLDCGLKSKGKKVSPFVLSSKESIQKAFLEEYINGDGYYDTRNRINPLLEVTSKSKQVIEGISLLSIFIKNGFPSIDYRKEKKAFRLRVVQYNKNCIDNNDISTLNIKNIKETTPTDGYVYDISVEDNHNFVCALGLIPAHNTDGVYMGCSRSISKLPPFEKALGTNQAKANDVEWLTSPDEAIEAIKECNKKWQRELNYPEFELEPEYHDAMVFVKHKNYLIFDEKNGIVEMATKGNNFKGSDKANIARKALKEIMINVLRDVSTWSDEDEARSLVKDSIRKHTQDVVASLDFSKVDIEDLTLIQSVKPAKSYKTNQDGGLSTFGKRAQALEKLLDVPIRSRMKFRFVVTKKSLPGIQNP